MFGVYGQVFRFVAHSDLGPLCSNLAKVSIYFGVGGLLLPQFDDLEVAEGLAIDDEAHQGALPVPSLQAGGAGVDVEHVQRGVVLHLEDVGVAGHEEVGRRGAQAQGYAAVVAAGIAADVLDQDIGLFAAETQDGGIEQAQVAAVAVAADGTQRGDVVEVLRFKGCVDSRQR